MRPDMNKDIKPYTLSILVQDIPGVLSQVARLFSRKGYNINAYFALRNLPDVTSADPATPLLSSIRRKKSEAPQSDGISRSGLYRVLCDFFEAAAAEVQERSAADAAKLRAGSTHWLRHTFATNALKTMDINLVQNAMGHASIGTTSRYLTPEESQIAQAMKKLPAL